MIVVTKWTGRTAAALQDALHETNEGFAELLGAAPRTVAGWHSNPDLVPRSEMQQALATIYERASEHVRRRFSLLSRPPEQPTQAQALRVAIAVVLRGDQVLLVCRRGDDALSWQFPAGMCKPGAAVASVAVQETHAETGVHCSVREELGTRVHPKTGVLASYVLCDYLAGEATNRDTVENTDVTWVPLAALTRFIPADRIFPPILSALEAA
ncbi:NUDIX domain-containing protein [Streptomyces poriferorum]|uniref:NUDIX hydrolase n=1 Tax=Streptomyces poriferorum TaxID=2798799 RepID=A0ABY9J0H7_9ACTN|nr:MULTISPECIES: NUDIX hydrolase [unclassified Streptomyces]MDP5310432.1 NUDIX hydrolase [Streptomyces sp. Alt4]WLQ60414.1 NUDIX hydrolase [Streptomyces sp. Alt2]